MPCPWPGYRLTYCQLSTCLRGLCVSHVLIADDDGALRAELKKVLEKAGHTVIAAATARETLNHAQDADFDLLLLDIKLPWLAPACAAAVHN